VAAVVLQLGPGDTIADHEAVGARP
jgi:hypothetical protein